jgi:nickel-dependent lactate racemase
MHVLLAYGTGHLAVEFPPERTTVVEPSSRHGLPDERAGVLAALDQPVAGKPLRDQVRTESKVTIVFTDITRPTPNERIIPWLLDYLSAFVSPANITLLNATGTHRPNTRAELEQLLTPEVVARYRVLNHEPEDLQAHVQVGVTRDGTPALLNRRLVDADVRIITGLIEPHFFAGFSGGPKGIMPGVAHFKTVMSNHCARNIGDPNAAFGITEGNPIWEEMREIALRAGDSFLLNVALNERRRITGVFGGDLIAAHRAGTEFVRSSAMQPVDQLFDIVVTTNSGYPLDMTLYQSVKGMSAGARILKPGGTLILVAECRDGVPSGGPMDQLLLGARTPDALLAMVTAPGSDRPEQWQVHIQALIQRRARVLVHSSIPDDIIRAAHLEPCHDIASTLRACLKAAGETARVAVLPQGPLTIPYVAQNSVASLSRTRY